MIPYYSLIVLAYNNWAFTNQCLISLLNSLEEIQIEKGIEIIVVDNGSNSETIQKMNLFRKKIVNTKAKLEFVMLKENLGYPSGMNVGIGKSKGVIIGVLNNDLLFPPNWLSPLVALLENDPLVGFAAPFMSYAGGSVQHVGKSFDTMEEMDAFAVYFTNLNKAHVIVTDKIIGACLIFRRDLLVSIGGNDFWYGIGNFDDVDWCLRARLAGYTITAVGGSFIHHTGHATFLQEPDLFNSSLQINQVKFERKWRMQKLNNESTNAMGPIKFERNKHYIPTQMSEFSPVDFPLFPRTSSAKRLLLCADWSNPQSEWPKAFSSLLAEHESTELFCWIPSSIYNTKEIIEHLHQLIASDTMNFRASSNTLWLIHEEVPYTDTLGVIRSVDAVVSVSQDFVNRYIKHLAELIGMNII